MFHKFYKTAHFFNFIKTGDVTNNTSLIMSLMVMIMMMMMMVVVMLTMILKYFECTFG
jgi:hypothetical protein